MITVLLKKIIDQLIILKARINKAKSVGQRSNYIEIKTSEYISEPL